MGAGRGAGSRARGARLAGACSAAASPSSSPRGIHQSDAGAEAGQRQRKRHGIQAWRDRRHQGEDRDEQEAQADLDDGSRRPARRAAGGPHLIGTKCGPQLEAEELILCTGGASRPLTVPGFELRCTHSDAGA